MAAKDLIALARAAAVESADYQQRFAAEDTEARKIVDIMEQYLRVKARVVYGGAAINAHLSPETKFYDPNLYLPDYDFLTSDPLQDCADLIVAFQREGFTEVEAKFGIHEGTYKVFVNFRAAADITYMPTDIYSRVFRDAAVIDGIHYASVDFLRMNMYLELSRPAGNVGRWEKVYERLLLLNAEHPIKAGRCAQPTKPNRVHNQIVKAGKDAGAIFLSELDDTPLLLMSDKADIIELKATKHDALGELLPARTEYHDKQGDLVAVVFETVACHSYTTVDGYRKGSLDLLIEIHYALYFAELTNYKEERLLCHIRDLIKEEQASRIKAIEKGLPAHDVFPLDCIGHQPTMPELKKAHRDRVRDKKKELAGALNIVNTVRRSRKRK